MSVTATMAIVRRATIDDADRISDLSAELGYPTPVETLRPSLEAILQRPEDVVFVAVLDGRVVGWAHGSYRVVLSDGARCEVLGLVVEEAHRGRGVGRRLMQAIEHWTREMGALQVTLRSRTLRSDAHRFYERLGYVQQKTQFKFAKKLSAS